MKKTGRAKPVLMRFDLNEDVGYQMIMKELLDMNKLT
jgi:hypothetical protein